jgi:catechol 2,3-dioxygenase-like lactoylglutathione lyase family enzyme
MIDHIGITTGKLQEMVAFYEGALTPLGMKKMRDYGVAIGFGNEQALPLWLADKQGPVATIHLAFAAPDRPSVDAFYHAAIAAGGRDNGPPGLRPQYHENYYGAFVLDPDGNNIEAVCHLPG